MNNGSDQFLDAGLSFGGTYIGSVRWGDYDNEGDLDFSSSGRNNTGLQISILYKNLSTISNDLPSVPTNLSAQVNGSSVQLSWSTSNDPQTNSNGLTYNLRIGTSQQGLEIVTPMSENNGYRKLVSTGNTEHNATWSIDNLSDGTYYWTVQAIDNNYAGSDFATESTFTIGQTIFADFIGTPTMGTAPLQVQFTDLSIGNPISWEWDFENDGIIDSYVQNPLWTYTSSGVYDVFLKVGDGSSYDSLVKSNYITVSEVLIADFSASPTVGTVPLQVQFSDQSIGTPISWEWDFENDGIIDSYEQNPQWTYNASGLFDVFLKVGNGSTYDSLIKTEYINVTEPGTPCPGIPSFVYGGQTYNTVLIGDQCWMKENINIGTRINGSQTQTDNSIIEKYCYEDLVSNCNEYGGLYQWNEMMQYTTQAGIQGICPEGWHLPEQTEWSGLISYLGGSLVAGGKMKESGYTHWNSPNTGATNESGFTGLPSGFREFDTGLYDGINTHTNIWSSAEYNTGESYICDLHYANQTSNLFHYEKSYGFPVRCIQDTASTPSVSANFSATPLSGQPPLLVYFYDQSTGDPTSWEWDFENDGTIDSYLQNPSFIYTSSGLYDVYLKVSNASSEDIIVKYDYINVTEPTYYIIQTFSSPEAGGNTYGGGNFPPDTSITVSAEPNLGYSFVKWTENGSIVSLEQNYTFTVTGDRDLIAHFSQGQLYSVITAANPPEGGITSGDGTYAPNESVTVTASTNLGYDFINWTENSVEVSIEEAYTFQITANRVLVANFISEQYYITVSAQPPEGGDVSGGGIFSYGVPATVIATANTGYNFIKWKEGENTVSIDPEYTFNVSGDRDLIAVFSEEELFTIITSAHPEEAGVTSGDGSFPVNDDVTIGASANPNWRFKNWSENSLIVSYDSIYTFAITSSRDLLAMFEQKQYHISVSANPAEGGTVSGDGSYYYQDEASVQAFPSPGWKFDHWFGEGTILSYDTLYTFTVTKDLDLTAYFSLKEVLSISIENSSPEEICQGDTVHLTAIAAGGDPPYEYQWISIPGGVSSNQSVLQDLPQAPITYIVTIADANLDEKSDTVFINVLESPPANIVGKGEPPYMLICIDSGYSYQWYFNENPINGEAKQFYYPGEQGLEIGTYHALVTNDLGCATKSNEFVSDKKMDFMIYPNPNEGNFNVVFKLIDPVNSAELIIMDMTGKVIKEVRLGGAIGNHRLSIKQKGVFIAELRTEGQRIIKKLIIY